MKMRDPEATKKAILDAAEAVFFEKGFAQVSTSEIAEKAGVTKSLIHHHFGSKDALWTQVKARRFKAYHDQQLQALRERPADAQLLRHSVELYFRFLLDNPDLVRMMAWMALERDTSTPEQFQLLTELGIARLAESQAAGRLRKDIAPMMILASFMGLVEHWFLHRESLFCCMGLDPRDRTVDEAYLQSILKIFFEGVEPRG